MGSINMVLGDKLPEFDTCTWSELETFNAIINIGPSPTPADREDGEDEDEE
ncbi:hypothetical protein ACNF42_00035 [Cuniculiplasma sp. SKW3]|uniref:hypothetical protein n=1 Tax=unclassified Cuniculiplasma TaxID=2619706 RepID=UPI003FD17A85